MSRWRQFLKIEPHCDNVCGVHCINLSVAESIPYRVRSVELFRNGVIVTFADGKCALFSADLLYASLSEAQELTDQSDQDDEEPGNREVASRE